MKYWLVFLLMLASPPAMSQEVNKSVSQEVPIDADRLNRIYEATVRVSVQGGTGTGTVFREDDQFYYILTNAHVATNQEVGLEFTKDHYPSPRFKGSLVTRVMRSGIDVAVVRIAKSALPTGLTLPVIPLATPEQVTSELFLVTSGCQAGERPSVQLTLTTRTTNGLIYYLPTSRPGRSGSALISRDGKTIQGLVAWMTDNSAKSEGLAMRVDVIRAIALGQTATTEIVSDFPDGAVQIPLAPTDAVESEIIVLSQGMASCPADSCLNGQCPWDYEYVNDPERTKDNPWNKRFGGPAQPKQDAPQQPQPDARPNNPWEGGPPRQTPPQQPQPQQPQPQERPKLFDGELMQKFNERLDKIDPKLDRLGEGVLPIAPKLDKLGEGIGPILPKMGELQEEVARQRKFFQNLPEELAKSQDGAVKGALRSFLENLLAPFWWAWNIAVFFGIIWLLNMLLSPILGANWFTVILKWVVSAGRTVITGIGAAWTAARQPLEETKPVAKATRKPRAKKTTTKEA
jgi:hypothetical protein